jgi:hypothetical protein
MTRPGVLAVITTLQRTAQGFECAQLRGISPYRAAMLGALSLLAACSSPGGAAAVSPAQAASFAPIQAQSLPGRAQRLYVGNGATITAYSLDKSNKLLGTIPNISSPYVAMSPANELFSSDRNKSPAILEYNGKSLKLIASYTENIAHPTRIIFDAKGTAYIEDHTYVAVYPNGEPTLSYKLKTKTKFPIWLAIAPDGNLYVSTPSDVEIFKPGARRPYRTITSGITDAGHIAVGRSGKLYVSNGESRVCGSVSIYKSGALQPTHAILPNKTTCDFGQIAEGPDGNLYVRTSAGLGQAGAISVYSSGHPSLLRTIQDGLVDPVEFSFDSQGNLYVADYSQDVIRIYAPGSMTVEHSISSGISAPTSLAFSI